MRTSLLFQQMWRGGHAVRGEPQAPLLGRPKLTSIVCWQHFINFSIFAVEENKSVK
jgi:hypothetical protein